MIQCVISDLGKVLILFDNGIFYRKIARFSSFSSNQIEKKVREHRETIQDFDTGKLSPQQFYKKVKEILKLNIGYSEFYSMYNDVFFLNVPVLNLFYQLKKNYRLVLLSNTDVMRFTFLKKKFPEILIFDEYILSYEVKMMKPNPWIFRKALQKGGVKPEDCVFVDDREENIQEAERLGIHTIHMKPHTHLENRLRKIGVFF
ncbi:HAD family phosphatase [bacterium]|nr:HAD family phosphatase [bacterium]